MRPGVEWLEEVDAAEERRLAAPARPDHDEHLAARDLEVDAVQHEVVPEALHDAVEPQQGLVRRLDGGQTGRLTPLHHWLHTRRSTLGQGCDDYRLAVGLQILLGVPVAAVVAAGIGLHFLDSAWVVRVSNGAIGVQVAAALVAFTLPKTMPTERRYEGEICPDLDSGQGCV